MDIQTFVKSLTPTEKDIVMHRLGVACAIFESLADDCPSISSKIVWDAASDLDDMLNGLEPSFEVSDTHIGIVLANCIEGSTYLASAQSAKECCEISPQKYASLCRAGDSLTQKASKLLGRRISIPHC